ncbi:UbiX family flavin prenyltransferase [Pseudoduganella sp. DS3]|uniref:Flavin prenyltransferase UbiX n=1 Tax=Pseudoduganella guangdongensis TaxID=2692179 RepID=A0A6N9HBV6_9BURK|nr:UbiX family flavin prenyltransferase [Pseudoduganella guangdongensis]MYN01041.1 UbiX family flavin prenyltransferase [Pseudoduganella guangdongensis]
MADRPQRLVIAITGATGAVYGVRLLQHLRSIDGVETHLVVSDAAVLTLHQETGLQRKEVEALADVVHKQNNIGASIASGSFQADGMVIAPCSMKTLASVAHGLSDNLIARAADVMLKERRRLILMVRETPFNLAHLRNMTAVTEMGGIIFPPLPSFYHLPQSIDEMVDHTVARVIDLFGLCHNLAPRWTGMNP